MQCYEIDLLTHQG